MAPDPIAQPHFSCPIAQILTIAQGHHDHKRRRARVQNDSMPLGTRDRGSTSTRRQPGRLRCRGHARGRLLGRGPTRRLPTEVDVTVSRTVAEGSTGPAEPITLSYVHKQRPDLARSERRECGRADGTAIAQWRATPLVTRSGRRHYPTHSTGGELGLPTRPYRPLFRLRSSASRAACVRQLHLRTDCPAARAKRKKGRLAPAHSRARATAEARKR